MRLGSAPVQQEFDKCELLPKGNETPLSTQHTTSVELDRSRLRFGDCFAVETRHCNHVKAAPMTIAAVVIGSAWTTIQWRKRAAAADDDILSFCMRRRASQSSFLRRREVDVAGTDGRSFTVTEASSARTLAAQSVSHHPVAHTSPCCLPTRSASLWRPAPLYMVALDSPSSRARAVFACGRPRGLYGRSTVRV